MSESTIRLAQPSAPLERRAFIGGSDARIIMGNDEDALFRLWREKRGEAEPRDYSANLIVQLGVATEGRIAAALSFRASNNQTCPAASGSSEPRLSKSSFRDTDDSNLVVSKPAARLNRIVRN